MDASSTPRLIEGAGWKPLSDFSNESRRSVSQLANSISTLNRKLRDELRLRADPFELRGSNSDIRIKTQGISGTVALPGISIDIAPKFVPQGQTGGAWNLALLAMVRTTRRRNVSFARSHHLAAGAHTFLDLLAMSFIDSVRRGFSDQVIQVYRVRELESFMLRGRLNVARQIRGANFLRPDRLQCDVDELDGENGFNALLKWAILTFQRGVVSPELRRQLVELLPLLPGTPSRGIALRARTINPPPQFRSWTAALEIAALLSAGLTQTVARGERSGYSFVFNMERVFEHFIERVIRSSCATLGGNFSTESQVRTLYAIPESSSARGFFSKPDNIVLKNGRPVVVVDAKYKRLSDPSGQRDRKPQSQDLYELVAAMTAQGCKAGLLVYPMVQGTDLISDDILRLWHVDSFGNNLKVGSVAVDLMKLSKRDAHVEISSKLAAHISALLV